MKILSHINYYWWKEGILKEGHNKSCLLIIEINILSIFNQHSTLFYKVGKNANATVSMRKLTDRIAFFTKWAEYTPHLTQSLLYSNYYS